MTRTAQLPAALMAIGMMACAGGGPSFDDLAASDRAMFQRCAEILNQQRCREGNATDQARCMDDKAALYAGRRSTRMRRSWLVANECPESLIDAPASAVAAVAPPAAPAPAPVAEPRPEDAPVQIAASEVVAEIGRPELSEPAPALPGASPQGGDDDNAETPPPPARLAPRMAAGQLREAVVAHEPDMKRCVDRQLKAVPTLRAEGKLVLEIDPAGRVVRAGLRGDQLEGTPLEVCISAVAARWRLPRTTRGYVVEAPLKISGAGQ